MKNKMLSRILFRILPIATLAVALALSGLSPVQASVTNPIVAWGWDVGNRLTIPTDLTDVIAIAAGTSHSLALKSDGSVVGWGSNFAGQISIPTDLTGVVAISAGDMHNLALKSDGTVVAWGHNYYGQSTVPVGLTNVVAIAVGYAHSLALKSDGTVVAWGNNDYGQINIPSGLTDVTAVAAGWCHSLALKSNGTVVAWGRNSQGETAIPYGLTGVTAISSYNLFNLALKSDGTVTGWGDNYNGQLNIPTGLTNVQAISAGNYHSLALKMDGTVVAWGGNTYGQLNVPSGLTGVTAISAGVYHSLALVSDSIPMNTAPTANPGGPYLGAVNTAIAFTGSLSLDPENDALTYAWTYGDGATGTGETPSHSYTAPGVYTVGLTVSDGSLSSVPVSTLAVIYDPSAGFVTGGGWIDSPAGAYKADASLAGKATFGFMSKYQKGASVPTGSTAFQFELAGLSFASQSYDWLVVNQDGTNAQFKGTGLINDLPDASGNAYKFMLWASDGADAESADTFRIRVWSEVEGVENVVYDNGVDQAIGGGNIVVHTGK